jgi:hypothetical protein
VLEGHEAGYIFPDQIEFEVDDGPWHYGLDVGMLEGVGDDGDIEVGFLYVKDGQAGAVERDGAFFDNEVAEFFGELESVLPAAVERLSFGAGGGSVYMALDDMAIEAAVEGHAAFEVDEVIGLPGVKVGFIQGLEDGGYAVGIVPGFFYGQADAVVGDALVDLQLGREGGLDPEGFVGSIGLDGLDFAEGFDDSGEHSVEIRKKWGEFAGFR